MDPFGDHLFDVFSKSAKTTNRISRLASINVGANRQTPQAEEKEFSEIVSEQNASEDVRSSEASVKLEDNVKKRQHDDNSSSNLSSKAPAPPPSSNLESVETKKLRLSVRNDDGSVTEKVSDSLFFPADDDLLKNLPRIKVHKVQSMESCLHEVAIPPGGNYVPLRYLPPSSRAKEYKFILDPFQKEAILCLDNTESVLVSAHTSAGKTVIAEYAIAMSLRDKQRVIYTTPIKALSNQKYRELFEEFGDVGLMTGDVTINPSASCLIMTTEILRSMLYRGSEITREVAWVIFDEIHYMRDKGGEGLYLVVDEVGRFREENFSSAMAVLREGGEAAKGDTFGRRGGSEGQTNCFKILQLIHDKGLTPCIIFSFSRRECEAYATEIFQKLDFNRDEEKNTVDEVFRNAMDVLSVEDKTLPQVQSVLPLLKRGIGIHHSGILPILKETIEILFAEGLIKALFATETFAMGLNMPARTVLFTAARKFDGKEIRWINSGEYIQMSGRAGRRGIDDRGIVILVIDERMSPNTAKDIIKGLPNPLNSAFKLTYNMVLNLLRVEGINPEFMLERSFHQFQSYASIPDLQKKLQICSEQYQQLQVPREEEVATYYKIRQQLDSLGNQLCAFINNPIYLLPFLQPGRLIKVQNGDDNFGWCVVLNFQKKYEKKGDEPTYILDVLASLQKESANQSYTAMIKPSSYENGEMEVIPINLSLVRNISAVRLYVPSDLRSRDNRQGMLKTLQEVEKRFPDGIPLLDPIEDMGIKDRSLHEIIRKIEAFEDRLYSHPLHSDPNIGELYKIYEKKITLERDLKQARMELKRARSLLMIEELRKRKRVLRRLGYCDQSDVVQLKGRVACEIDSSEELILTEMLFNGVFNDLGVAQAAALLSCFVFQERHHELPKLPAELSGPLRVMQDTARRIAKVTNECKIEIDEEKYVDSFKPYMMDVVNAWVNGSSFAKITKMTGIFEGSIIRCIRRLEELLRQMSCAAKAIGNDDLEAKFLEAISYECDGSTGKCT